MKPPPHHPESPLTILALLRPEPNRIPSMHVMMKKRRPRRSVARVMGLMRTSDVCVRIHNAGWMKIGSVESRAVHPRPMRVSHNPEARFQSEPKLKWIIK